jgi:hypothetical protein
MLFNRSCLLKTALIAFLVFFGGCLGTGTNKLMLIPF